MILLGVALAGAVGAITRYVVDLAVQSRTSGDQPWGTFVVNATGSLVLGFLTGLVLYHAMSSTPKTLLGTGFCGAYTTFSTFTFESIRLAEDGELMYAVRNVALHGVVPLLAAAAGLALAML